MKASQLIARIRTELRDTVEPYRWSDDVLLQLLNEGQRTISAYRPEAKYVSGSVSISEPEDCEDSDSDISVVDTFATAIVFYVCYRALSQDWEHGGNLTAAANYERLFRQELL